MMAWAVIGWPVVAAAILAFGVAFSTRHTWVGFAGALIAAPLCLYLTDMPYLHWVSLAALAANFVSVAALWRGRHDIAFAMLLPFMLMIVLIVILWLRNFSVFSGFHF
jgi:glucose-6-phosphate-specific signal transduction histidine kinase